MVGGLRADAADPISGCVTNDDTTCIKENLHHRAHGGIAIILYTPKSRSTAPPFAHSNFRHHFWQIMCVSIAILAVR